MNTSTDSDREAILSHVHGLFRAFLAKDRDAIRAGHTEDWKGFQIGSRELVRGIDAYMRAADQVLGSVKAVDYEFLDVEVEVFGDHALVWYLARDFLEGGGTALLRSVDVYRRDRGGWNQCGSHIAAFPESAAAVTAPPAAEGADSATVRSP